MTDTQNLDTALQILENTKSHIDLLIEDLKKDPENLNMIVSLMQGTSGKIIISGIGKSGHIGKKIAATLSSTGTPSMFINSNEALHGDIGLMHSNDLLILISNSGNQKEMDPILHYAKNIKVKIVSITKNKDSDLVRSSDLSIVYRIEKEGIANIPLAPIVSTEIVLAIGHILTSCLVAAKNIQEVDYAKFHPGGDIGKKLAS